MSNSAASASPSIASVSAAAGSSLDCISDIIIGSIPAAANIVLAMAQGSNGSPIMPSGIPSAAMVIALAISALPLAASALIECNTAISAGLPSLA